MVSEEMIFKVAKLPFSGNLVQTNQLYLPPPTCSWLSRLKISFNEILRAAYKIIL